MRARLLKLLFDIRTSYWFVPMLMVLAAMCLASAASWLDSLEHSLALSWMLRITVDDARMILSTIATTVLGVAGVTFSITIVAVSFASSNYGPRLINNFMRDKGSQYTLGTFIATFVYCLSIMTTVHGASTLSSGQDVEAFVPAFGIVVALLLTFASISVLIYFIHHITETINIENIVADIGRSLQSRITELFPVHDADTPVLDSDFEQARDKRQCLAIRATRTGYVQAIDLDRLNELAVRDDLLIRVHYRPGDFTTVGDCLLSSWYKDSEEPEQESMRECFATGEERTEHQNVLFLIEQLGEVIARALSPGINDPYTAISSMNWYRTALMSYLSAQHERSTEDHTLPALHRTRVQLHPVPLERVCQIMFTQTRQYVSNDRIVALHTMAILAECAWHAGPGDFRALMLRHLHTLHDCSSRQLQSDPDVAQINERLQQALEVIEQSGDPDQLRQRHAWFGGSA